MSKFTVAKAKSRLGVLSRAKAPAVEIAAARSALTAELMNSAIEDALAAFPPLTAEQKQHAIRLLEQS